MCSISYSMIYLIQKQPHRTEHNFCWRAEEYDSGKKTPRAQSLCLLLPRSLLGILNLKKNRSIFCRLEKNLESFDISSPKMEIQF